MLKLTSNKKRLLLFILLGWVLLLVGDRVGELRQYQGSFVATYSLAIASIILLTGYSGQLSLGHSALMLDFSINTPQPRIGPHVCQ